MKVLPGGSPLRCSGRAITRDPDVAGLPAGVDVRRADLADPETLEEPLDGIESVFLLWSLTTTRAAPRWLDAVARRAAHIVYGSSDRSPGVSW